MVQPVAGVLINAGQNTAKASRFLPWATQQPHMNIIDEEYLVWPPKINYGRRYRRSQLKWERVLGSGYTKACHITLTSWILEKEGILWCASLSHRYFCANFCPPSKADEFLIPRAKILLLVLRIYCIERFSIASKLRNFLSQNEVNLADGKLYPLYCLCMVFWSVFAVVETLLGAF